MGLPRTADSCVKPGARLARSWPRPGPNEGDHPERERLPLTKTVRGPPLRRLEMPANCQPENATFRRPRAFR